MERNPEKPQQDQATIKRFSSRIARAVLHRFRQVDTKESAVNKVTRKQEIDTLTLSQIEALRVLKNLSGPIAHSDANTDKSNFIKVVDLDGSNVDYLPPETPSAVSVNTVADRNVTRDSMNTALTPKIGRKISTKSYFK